MKKGINGWAFGGRPLPACMAVAEQAGFEGFELVFEHEGPVSPQASAADMKQVLDLARRHNLEIASVACGLFWSVSPSDNDPEVRRRAAEIGRSLLRYAAGVGVDSVLVIPGMVDMGWQPGTPLASYDVAVQRARVFVDALAPTAEEVGVTIAVENVWNKILLSPTEMRTFIDGFDSRYVGAYVDVANMLPYGYPEDWLRILDHRVSRVHAKNYRYGGGLTAGHGFVDLLEGDVNYPEVIRALEEIGYDGWVTAEISPYQHYPDAAVHMASLALDYILGRRGDHSGSATDSSSRI